MNRQQQRRQEDIHNTMRLIAGIGLAFGFFATSRNLTTPWVVLIGGLVGLDRVVAAALYLYRGGQGADDVSNRDGDAGGGSAQKAVDPRPFRDPDVRDRGRDQLRVVLAHLAFVQRLSPQLAV